MVQHSAIDHTGLTGAGGSMATDAIWDAPGDLAVGTGANTAARLAKGAALQVLRVNAGATALEWTAPAVAAFASATAQTLTTSVADLVSMTLSATPAVTETWLVTATFDFDWTTLSAGNLALGTIVFSGTGTLVSGQAILSGDDVHRVTVSLVGIVTGVDAAAHTIKAQVRKTGAGGVCTAQANGSRMTLLRIPE